jgi:D-lyxose ketol-isomerase
MNTLRQRHLAAKKEFKKPVTKFEPINLETAEFVPKGLTRAFRNTRYTVMVFDNHPVTTGFASCVMVQKHDATPIIRHWSEMQKIKNEIFGEETTAIEYYPAKSKLIDEHDIYWFWIFPEGVLPMPVFSK